MTYKITTEELPSASCPTIIKPTTDGIKANADWQVRSLRAEAKLQYLRERLLAVSSATQVDRSVLSELAEDLEAADAGWSPSDGERGLAHLYAELNATNEALLHATSSEELFDRVSRAATESGQFSVCACFLPDETQLSLRQVAVTGSALDSVVPTQTISVDPSRPGGQHLAAVAFRTGRAVIINDVLGDERFVFWHQAAKSAGTRSAGAFPLLDGTQPLGVIVLSAREKGVFDETTVRLFQRMAENAAFALINFEREKQRQHLTRLYAMLNATNEAVVRATSAEELFESVCNATTDSRHYFVSAIALPDEAERALVPVAVTGPGAERFKANWNAHIESERPVPSQITFSSGEATIINDFHSDQRFDYWQRNAQDSGVGAVAVFPLLEDGNTIGVITLSAYLKNVFDDDTVTLLRRMAENVAFALGNFKRESQRQRFTRMYAALSATNDAIIRVRSIPELYQRVCDAAVNDGKFSAASIYLAQPDSHVFLNVAAAGKHPARSRAAHINTDESHPEGACVAAIAVRSRSTCISNDTLNDDRLSLWRESLRATNDRSLATVPILQNDGVIGLITFALAEKNGFNDEIVGLLERMAENVAFALDNFERESQRKDTETRMEYMATHDVLTGLVNRAMFHQLLTQAIECSRRYNWGFAVLFLDLDRFKTINDTLGHDAGDQLLQELAQRFSRCLRSSDVIGRLGGDEFIVLVRQIESVSQVEAIANKLLSAATQPIKLQNQECRVTASIGISLFPSDAADEQSLMKNADMAMYFAKREGKNNFQFYSREITTPSLVNLMIESNLRRALENNELTIHYQPKVDLRTGEVTGVEALLRWHSPTLGSISPDQFIPIAEETGTIIAIGRWALEAACLQSVEWHRMGLPPLCMAVNISQRQFADPQLLKHLQEALERSRIAPHLLELEITESMIMQNTERAVTLLNAIKAMGVRIAIDDFGTGYSSLAQLKRFPIDTIKIDRSFICDIPDDAEDNAITEAIIAIGKRLGLKVVAEGVENAQQQQFLREHGCDEMQGFLFSKPIEPAPLAALLSQINQRSAPSE